MNATTDRPGWLAARKSYLGGTDIAAIAGFSPWATPLDVYMDKLGLAKESEPNLNMVAGIALEPVLRAQFVKDTGFTVTESPTIYHPEHPFLAANVDGLVNDNAILEIKTYGNRNYSEWGTEESDEVPTQYHVQCQWYLGITGRPYAHLYAVHLGWLEPKHFIVHYDADYYRMLVDSGVKFWRDHIEGNVPPKATERDEDSLRVLYAVDNGEILMGERSDDRLAESLIDAKTAHKEATVALDSLKCQMIQRIGDAAGIDTFSGRFTFKTTKKGSRTFAFPKDK